MPASRPTLPLGGGPVGHLGFVLRRRAGGWNGHPLYRTRVSHLARLDLSLAA
jgi:hypothetical protein